MTSGNYYNGDDTSIKGSDGTIIGNILDRLKVTTAASGDLVYRDMNVSTGGVARDTEIGGTFTTLYSFTGSGALIAFLARLDKSDKENWEVRVVVDGSNLLQVLTADIKEVYELDDDAFAQLLGVTVKGDGFRFAAPSGQILLFNTSVQIQVRKVEGSPRKFRGGLVAIVQN